ncbi:MAG: GDP-L-fucose synthase family protein, partial [Gemmatimonadaceae bacterium]
LSPSVLLSCYWCLLGFALFCFLVERGSPPPLARVREDLDLADAGAVQRFFTAERPDVVYLAAAKVGGILANDTYRWDFLYQNLLIETSVLGAALESGVERVVFFGSSCIYPRLAPQPISEDALLTGPLEQTNEPYAIAKIAGLKLVEAANTQHGRKWVSLMPTNLYGPGDNFDLETSHVLPAMIRKFHEAKVAAQSGAPVPVVLWGTGAVQREFLHVDDLALAALHVATSSVTGLINVGYGSDVTIRELAEIVSDAVGYQGEVEWDTSKPDGSPRKLLDSGRIFETGWRPRIDLGTGVKTTYDGFLASSGVTGGVAAPIG